LKKIIIFTDSLGRPRPDLDRSESTEYEDVYGYKVREYFSKVLVELLYVESLDSDDAIFWNKRMVAFKRPDIVVYHLGINDCVPRLFKKNSKSVLLRPFFQKITKNISLRLISKFRRHIIRALPLKVYVEKDRFQKNLIKMINDVKEFSPECTFLCLSIAGQTKFMENKNPGVTANTKEYNKVLKAIFKENYIDIDDLIKRAPEKYLISDGIHFNKDTHNKIAQELIKRIEKIKCVE